MDNLLDKNLANVKKNYNLFGDEENALSIKDRIGFVPISIWQPDWNIVKRLKEIIGDSGQTRELTGKKMALMGSKYETSIFNPHLAQMILSAYCPPKAKIFDPFAGGGTRDFIATAMEHKYSGIELRQVEVDRILEQQKILQLPFYIKCMDACKVDIQNNFFDFCYTCPPYYNLEVYSNEKDDLSAAKTYNDFLSMITQVLQNTFNTLKPGAIAVWVVGNFRNDKTGELYHFNGDLIKCAKTVGFKLHDELIFWGASGSAAQRAGQFEANRKSVRVHEYIVVLKK